MAFSLMPSPYQTVLDGSGNPINGAKVFVYLAGTTTKTITYSEISGTSTANTNPIIADSAGRFVAFLDPNVSYKFVYALPTDSDPPVSPFETVDNITLFGEVNQTKITITAGETLADGDWIYCAQGEAGTTAGRWYLTSAAQEYSSVRAKQIAICLSSLSVGETGEAFFYGVYTPSAGAIYTPGNQYYLASATGDISSTPPVSDQQRAVGLALTDSTLLVGYHQVGGTTPRFTPGVGTDAAVTSGVIEVNSDAVTAAAGVPLFSYTVPAGTLNQDNRGLRVTIWGQTAANANNKQVTITAEGDTLLNLGAAAYNGNYWKIVLEIIRTGSATGISCCLFQPSLATGGFSTQGPTINNAAIAHDWTTAFQIVCSGTFVGASDVTKAGAIVEVIN